MTPDELLDSHGDDEPARFLAAADYFAMRELPALVASALDRAYGLAPDDAALARHRKTILDGLAVVEHGLELRYIPAGTFVMGSPTGDADERPVHPRRLDAFWIAEIPLTWTAYCRLVGWEPPPQSWPQDERDPESREMFILNESNKIRRQYCETETLTAVDWHAHAGAELFGEVPRADRSAPPGYEQKPMVAVSLLDAGELIAALSTATTRYTLPTEAQWEKAARGGLVGRRYSWGDDPPARDRCDFDRMGDFRLGDPRQLPPNGYGIYGMCGGVAELTADRYDALAYARAARGDVAPIDGAALQVIRGGSWTDCASAVTVSFRATASGRMTPNLGLRLVRELA